MIDIAKELADKKEPSNEPPSTNAITPVTPSRQQGADKNAIMYPYPPDKNGRITAWNSDSSQTKPLWRKQQQGHPNLKEPAPKKQSKIN